MANRQMIENALKIACDDLIIDDDNVNKDECDDVVNEFSRLMKTIKKEAEDAADEDDGESEEDLEDEEEGEEEP